jgi:HEAT repeat protein
MRNEPWLWGAADAIAAALLLLNLAVLVFVHARRVRGYVRQRRERRFQPRVEAMLAELSDETSVHGPEWLRAQVRRFNELERPIAATMLIERMQQPISAAERERALAVLREAGAIDLMARSTRRWMPWRRALAVRTLGWVGAAETAPVVLERLEDRNRYVREAAVRALARMREPRALPLLTQWFYGPGPVGAGVVYDALVAFGRESEPVFAQGLQAPDESVRIASCFGIAAVSDPPTARRLLEHALADETTAVRAAAAEAVGHIGGEALPQGIASATRDEQPAVRSAATSALASFDDVEGVGLAVAALADPDRDVVVRAGETLVRLARLPAAGSTAAEALRREDASWPVERAVTLGSLGAIR